MDRRVTPPKRVTSPTWGPPRPCKQALNLHKNRYYIKNRARWNKARWSEMGVFPPTWFIRDTQMIMKHSE